MEPVGAGRRTACHGVVLGAHQAVVRCSWACTAHFCYLCRQTLRGTKGPSGSHFGKAGSGKCRQHSPD